MKQKNFSIKKRVQSFKHALNGFRILFCEESNSWIHLLITFCVLVAGFVFTISATEWIIVIFCVGLVFALELINTSIENMADFISQEYHNSIKKTKDLAAGAVLVSAISAAIIGLIIFIPRIIGLIR